MNKVVSNSIDCGLVTISTAWSIENIDNILGIILLIIQILWISSRCVISIYNRVKSKKFTEIPKDLEETIEDIESLLKKDKKDE